jgi:hypothetical protein
MMNLKFITSESMYHVENPLNGRHATYGNIDNCTSAYKRHRGPERYDEDESPQRIPYI